MNDGGRRLARTLVPVLVVLLGATMFAARWPDRHPDPTTFDVGSCFNVGPDTGVVAADGLVQLTGRATVVGCAAPHDAVITRLARASSDCAADGAWIESRSRILCVRLSG